MRSTELEKIQVQFIDVLANNRSEMTRATAVGICVGT